MAFNLFKRGKQEKSKAKTSLQDKSVIDEPKSLTEKQDQSLDEAGLSQAKKEQAPKAVLASAKKTKKKHLLQGVLMSPHITEKATFLKENGKYVFRVYPSATKGAVKGAVESLYGVKVQNVHLIKKAGKKIRIGKKSGLRPGLKKAVVQMKAGQNIEVISR